MIYSKITTENRHQDKERKDMIGKLKSFQRACDCIIQANLTGSLKLLCSSLQRNAKPSGRLERNCVKWWLEKENTKQKSWQERKETKPSMFIGVKAAAARGWHAQGASLLLSVIPKTDFLARPVPSPLLHSPAFLQVLSLSCPTSPTLHTSCPKPGAVHAFGNYIEYHHTKRAV